MRFRADQHLRRPGDIRAVREQGQRLECRAFTLWWKQRPALAPASSDATTGGRDPRVIDVKTARVCVIASTAAVGDAVRRNRAKRRLRELFRQHQLSVPADCDLLLIARRAVIDCPLQELESRFSDACRKIGAGKS